MEPASPHNRALSFPSRPIVTARSTAEECPIGRLAALLRRHARLTVCLAGSDWEVVDRARESLDDAGLADRVTVHHAAALALTAPLARRAAS